MTPEELFEENQRLITYTIQHYYPTYTGDEDIFQIVALGLWKACVNYDQEKSKFATFATNCMRNEVGMYFRYWNRPKRISEVGNISLDANMVTSDGDETSFINLLPSVSNHFIDFDGFMNSLTARQKYIVSLKVNDHLNGRQISKILGISAAQVSRELAKIRVKFNDYI